MSRYRLVTQNLLASAAQAILDPPTKMAVEDLASLITTLALYDGIITLGDSDIWDRYAQQSDLIALLKVHLNFVPIRSVKYVLYELRPANRG